MAPDTKDRRPSPSVHDKPAILRAHALFSQLKPEIIDRLASYAITQHVKRNTTIFRKGDTGTSLYAVCVGTVRISAPSEEGKDAVFNLINAGDIFGEIALLDGGTRTADAVALTDCELMRIERRDFIPLVREQPDVAIKLIEVLCSRIRNSSEQIEDVLFLDMPGRLAKTLLRLSGANEGSKRTISVTQREIGQIVGISRESTNKQLRAWEERNWIKLEKGSVVVIKPDALAALVAAGSEGAAG
jgi:CRP/FNR family cyclic AMP-dependent transcriptional regulator